MIARNERIGVRAGDVYGIHYPSGATRGVVPYDQSNRIICCGVSPSDLSRNHNDGKYDSDFPVGIFLRIFFYLAPRLACQHSDPLAR